MKNKLLIFLFGAATLIGCNKIENYSTKLQRDSYWEVKSITINGEESGHKGQWHVSDGDIYSEVQIIEWQSVDNQFGDAIFEWQFQDKGKAYQLNYVQLCEECNSPYLDSLDEFAYSITGKYEVVKHKRNKMEFASSNTIGYNGKPVVINIERVK